MTVKRSSIVLAIMMCIIMAMPAFGQSDGKGIIGKGFKIGLSVANFSGSDKDLFAEAIADIVGMTTTGFKSRAGFAFGGFLTFGLSQRFAIQPELMYVQKGGKLPLGGVDVAFKLDCIEIPILATFLFPSSTGSVTSRFYAGPSISFKSSSNLEVQGVSVDISDAIKGTGLGITFGGGIEFGSGATSFTLDGRYTLGMSDVYDSTPSLKVKNNNFSILGGVSF